MDPTTVVSNTIANHGVVAGIALLSVGSAFYLLYYVLTKTLPQVVQAHAATLQAAVDRFKQELDEKRKDNMATIDQQARLFQSTLASVEDRHEKVYLGMCENLQRLNDTMISHRELLSVICQKLDIPKKD